jgi:hypothetical protein
MFKLCELGSKVTDHNYGHLTKATSNPLKGGMVVKYAYTPDDDANGRLINPVADVYQAIVANPLDNYTFKVSATEDDFEFPVGAYTKVYPMYALEHQFVYISKDVFVSAISGTTIAAGTKLYPSISASATTVCLWNTTSNSAGYCLVVGGDLGDKVWGEIQKVVASSS